MARLAPLPPTLLDRPFSRREARILGVTDGRLGSSDLVAPFHGVRVSRGCPAELRDLCRALCLRMPEGTALSHSTAAQLWGLPVPLYARSAAIETSTRVPGQPMRVTGVVGHELSATLWRTRVRIERDFELADLWELSTLDPVVVWAQLASTLDVHDLVAVADALLASGSPLAAFHDLEREAHAWRGMRGATKLRRAVGLARAGSRSRAESLLRLQLADAGIPVAVLNEPVFDPRGREIHVPDLQWPDYRVLVEFESAKFHLDKRKFRSDITRFEEYADGGWTGIRVQSDDLYVDPNPTIGRIWRRLVANGWHPSREPAEVRPARL